MVSQSLRQEMALLEVRVAPSEHVRHHMDSHKRTNLQGTLLRKLYHTLNTPKPSQLGCVGGGESSQTRGRAPSPRTRGAARRAEVRELPLQGLEGLAQARLVLLEPEFQESWLKVHQF